MEVTAERLADRVDELLGKRWDRRAGGFIEPEAAAQTAGQSAEEPAVNLCSCGSGIPVTKVIINGQTVEIVALPLIFEQFREARKVPAESDSRAPGDAVLHELMETVKIYNAIPAETEPAYAAAVLGAYTVFCQQETTS